MKNAYVFLLIFAALQVCGQTEKGNSLLSGSFSTRYETMFRETSYDSKVSNTSIGLGLSYGKFVEDNMLWEGSLYQTNLFTGAKSGRNSSDRYQLANITFGIGTGGTYFFGKNQWRGFVGAGVNVSTSFYNSETKSSTNASSNSKRTSVSVSPIFKAGAIYFIDKHWALQLATSSNSFPISFSGASLGLLYWVRPTSFRVEEASFSTLQKGNWSIGIDAGLSSLNQKENNSFVNNYKKLDEESNYQLGIKLGKFVANRTIVGVKASTSFNKDKEEYVTANSNYTQSSRFFSGGVFVKRYLATSRFTPFVETSFDFTRINSKQESIGFVGDAHVNTYQLGVNAGVAYLISNRFLVEAEFAEFNVQYNAPSAGVETLSTVVRGQLSPSFTLSYVF